MTQSQQFITHSKWSAREVLDHVATDGDELIGMQPTQRSLSTKVGLQNKQDVCRRQSSIPRTISKVDNGQVRLRVCKGRFATAIDTRLYLPKEWTDDAERCNKAGIPESEGSLRPKANWL